MEWSTRTSVAFPVLLFVSALCGLPQGSPARADAPTRAVDPGPLNDPLDAQAWVARHGDLAVLEGLGEAEAPSRQLRAAFAACWMVGPERALASLAVLAGGRDPRVAPAAAAAALCIALALDPRDMAAREVERAVLEEGRAAFEDIAGDDTVRPDIARLAAFTVAHLAGVTGEE